jgi:hypothetical protein
LHFDVTAVETFCRDGRHETAEINDLNTFICQPGGDLAAAPGQANVITLSHGGHPAQRRIGNKTSTIGYVQEGHSII